MKSHLFSCVSLAGATWLAVLLVSGVALGGGDIYWTDSGAIHRADEDGSNVETLLERRLGDPVGIALHPAAGKMYWTDSATGSIQRSNLDGSEQQTFLALDLVATPRGIAIDPIAGKLYWSQHRPDRIRRVNLDGTGVEDVLASGVETPGALVLDLAAGQVYWVENRVTIFTTVGWLQRANLDGSSVEEIGFIGLGQTRGLALDPGAGKIYITHLLQALDGSETGHLLRSELDGSNSESLFVSDLSLPVDVGLDPDAGKVYWTNAGSAGINRADLDGSNLETLLTAGLAHPQGLALGLTEGRMYWTDRGTLKIQRSQLDGSDVEDLVTSILGNPSGIALDPVGEKLYWTDPRSPVGPGRIQRANLDGSNPEDLVTQGVDDPTAITVDPAAGKMYWVDAVAGAGRVQRANLDGSEIELVVSVPVGFPRGIALDRLTDKVYWTEAEAGSFAVGRVKRANLDGSTPEVLLEFPSERPGPEGITVDALTGWMTWSINRSIPFQDPLNTIRRARLDGTSSEDLFVTKDTLSDVCLASGSIYWASHSSTEGQVHRARPDGSEREIVLGSGLVKPRGLAVIPEPMVATGFAADRPEAGFDGFIRVFESLQAVTGAGAVGTDSGFLKGIAVDPATGLTYAIDLIPGEGGQQLYVMDPADGIWAALPQTTGVPTPAVIWGLAFDGAGQLYAGGLGVYLIDKATGQASPLAKTQAVPAFITGMAASPNGIGFLSTGWLTADDTLPYLALHDASGAIVPGAVFLLIDSTGEDRPLLDIGLSSSGVLLGNAWSELGSVGEHSDLVRLHFTVFQNVPIAVMEEGTPVDALLFGFGGPPNVSLSQGAHF